MVNRKHFNLYIEAHPVYPGKRDYFWMGTEDDHHESWLSWIDNKEDAQKYIDDVNSKYYLWDYSEEEIKEWLNTINFKWLTHKIEEQLGLSEDTLHFELLEFKMKSNGFVKYGDNKINLVDGNPIIRSAWKKMYVESFGGGVIVDEETGELNLWLCPHLTYEHWDGGTNGAAIGTFTYSLSDGYKYITQEERNRDRQ